MSDFSAALLLGIGSFRRFLPYRLPEFQHAFRAAMDLAKTKLPEEMLPELSMNGITGRYPEAAKLLMDGEEADLLQIYPYRIEFKLSREQNYDCLGLLDQGSAFLELGNHFSLSLQRAGIAGHIAR